MKYYVAFLLITISFAACKKDSTSPGAPAPVDSTVWSGLLRYVAYYNDNFSTGILHTFIMTVSDDASELEIPNSFTMVIQ
jgi:hypothetical protein